MEPVETTIKTVHVVYTKVEQIHDDFVGFEGSHESIYFGPDHPFKVGNRVKITFERIGNAPSK